MAKRKPNKRRRLPNGFGQISELKGKNLRKPFRAMVTVGKNDKGRPICKLLKPEAYFETYNGAYAALLEYNKNPYEKMIEMTMTELYEKWSDWYFDKITESSKKNIITAWKYCHPLHNMKVTEIRPMHIRDCIENAYRDIDGEKQYASANVKSRMKSLCNMLFDYAVEYDVVEHNIAREMKLSTYTRPEAKDHHMPFTDSEMKILWEHTNIPFVKIILIHCYSGWRPLEMCSLKVVDTNITEWTFKGGVKTESGKNRTVPIHTKVRPFVEEFYNLAISLGSEYLFNVIREHSFEYDDLSSYSSYRYYFKKVVAELNINPDHKPHDCRKHFVTMAKKNKVDEYAIKYLVGHKINDLTERVYTSRDFDWLRTELEKLK